MTPYWVAALLRFALDQTARTNLLVPLLVSAVIYSLGYMAMREPEVKALGEAKGETPSAPKYERSTLTPERAERYTKKLLHLMETERPYTDGALNIQKLAARLSIPAQHLSQIVNERLNQSFTDFVNAIFFDGTQNNGRISAGIVFRFGKR